MNSTHAWYESGEFIRIFVHKIFGYQSQPTIPTYIALRFAYMTSLSATLYRIHSTVNWNGTEIGSTATSSPWFTLFLTMSGQPCNRSTHPGDEVGSTAFIHVRLHVCDMGCSGKRQTFADVMIFLSASDVRCRVCLKHRDGCVLLFWGSSVFAPQGYFNHVFNKLQFMKRCFLSYRKLENSLIYKIA